MDKTVSVTTEVDAPASTVYELVSDLPRMGSLSPENTGGRWLAGAAGPAVGARFKGTNRLGLRRWSTTATVTDATPPHRFAFDIDYLGVPIATWSYEVADREGGCTVVETWVDRRPAWMRVASAPVMGVADRAAHNARGMQHTLANLKRTAEAS